MLEEALYYHSLGWSIIPIKTNSKIPAISWQEFQTRKATRGEVEKWFTNTEYNIGLVCGKISNVSVVDIDEYKKPDTLDISSPVFVNTPRGGRHLYFKYSEKILTTANADLAIDIRSDGGYVLLPPSIHPNGKPYTWGNKKLISNLPEAPEVLKKVFTKVKGETFDLREYLNVSEGSRNDSLYKVAVSLLSKHSTEIAIQLIISINLNYNPPLPDNEVQTILRSAQKFVENNPPHKSAIALPSTLDLSQKLSDLQSKHEDFKLNTGYRKIDNVINGLRSGGTYLVAGYEKSGKSSFLAKIASNLLAYKTKISYLNTELSDNDFITLMTGLHLNKAKDEVTDDERKIWTTQFSEGISYFGISELSNKDSGVLDFEKTMQCAIEAVKKGCKVLIFDNLTTYSTQTTAQNKGWEILSSACTRVINFSKEHKIICIVVIHTRPDVLFSDTPKGIRSFIENGTPERIFDKSLAVVRRPLISDVYGGGGYRSQLAGTFLIWRPFQFFGSEDLNSMSQVLLESFRNAPSTEPQKMIFHGEKGLFTEIGSDDNSNVDFRETLFGNKHAI